MSRPNLPRPVAPLAGLAAPTFAAWAVIAADIGRVQMSAQGVICGAATPHCAWCYAAAALGLAAVSALMVAVRPVLLLVH